MTALPQIQYFLGANAPTGFYSLYDHLLPPEEARAIYILKGGPGCGKSTLMRQAAARLEEAGHPVEYILCSGDPASLDAILVPGLGAAIVDGTAPHVIEPKYPGAVERYVNMGACYDTAALWPLRREIMDLMAAYKGCYTRAYRILGAAGEILEEQRAAMASAGLDRKLAKRAQGILSREFPRRKGVPAGRVKRRFLGAVTCRGAMTLYDSALDQCPRIYQLMDPHGLAHGLLAPLLEGAAAAGYDVVACPDPMAPDRLAHLLVPELGLAFLSRAGELAPPGGKPYRRIRLEDAAGSELPRRNRPRLRFAKKVSAALLEEGVSALAQAKALHDQLELVYNPHVDFGLVSRISQELAEEILSLQP